MPKKLCEDQIKKYFEDNNCKLLSSYIGINHSLKYICSCGEISTIHLKEFRKGHRCKKCGIKKSSQSRKASYESVAKCFQDRGCKLLEKEYKNCEELMEYICKNGHRTFTRFASFKQGHGCKKCSVSGSNSAFWNPDREFVALAEIFRKRCYRFVRSCLKATGQKKNTKTQELLGYGPRELMDWITNHPNWENVKDKEWHIDHIFPIKAFVEYKVTDLSIVNHLENLRPATAEENLSKGDKYSKEEFEIWLAKHNDCL